METPKHLPPLLALRAFEAVARHLSFSLAAQELCVSGLSEEQVSKARARSAIRCRNSNSTWASRCLSDAPEPTPCWSSKASALPP